MKKKLLCAALFIAGISSAHADERTWNFVYQGFVDDATGVFDSKMKYSGSFTGEDRNLDGIVALDELSYFESQGHEYLPEKIIIGSGDCGSSYLKCTVREFSYALTGKLNFSVGTYGADEVYVHWWSSSADTGYNFGSLSGNTHTGETWSDQYNWSDRTTLTISLLPVPEPAVALMLPAGLALMCLARVRRRKIPA
ncbi:PEP-CTERM sorting domain-containing protein [Janthinobacterium sp. BJB1]|uniref:PEP-CTERM sorting domain-containing protein n=1 Tax=Janthinobacterium sp. GW458P TaxID=1981504 RepID=UPI000A322239|nr:PEP-CTERM sorting domain-containing protein [Janthinobacterium sp. GW458P]MBE3026591.1 PEP-CTERM sorting domain-containing protein [Janthinobacterium sp. GW458P]PHV16943.1 PEP-CTERM sorting domain-containing protein [Janthinobacterium sp. BJB303]PJC97774.1 PEP-CTERM sorting domain-containing protein [Janthinobacterium sp. BJB1]